MGNGAIVRYMLNKQSENIEDLADIFKALSNPNRLRIFLKLIRCCKPGTVVNINADDSAYIGELGADLGIVKSTVSHHIKELKRAGLIRTERQGQRVSCCVDPEIIKLIGNFFRV